MIWVNSIDKLWANRKKANEICYCDPVVYPNDMILQHRLNTNALSGFSCEVYIYSSNGMNLLSPDRAPYFSFLVGIDPYGNKFFNLRCEQFAPEMCSNECYILRVKIFQSGNLLFDKYTEIYCQNTCCTTPRGITISTENGIPESLPDVEPEMYFKCNIPLIRIRAVFECIDNETGYFYGIPSMVLQGSVLFSYEKIFNFPGKITNEEREIETIISYNCKLQRSESAKQYLIKGNSVYSMLPDWKRNELENMLHASTIEVTDPNFGKNQYLFRGGTIGERAHSCFDMWVVNFTLEECPIRTDFGCGECAYAVAKTFLIPLNSNNRFYSETRQFIGDYSDLKNYFESIGFVVTDVTGEYENISGAFTASGQGIIPYFYYNTTYQRDKIYGTETPISPTVSCGIFDFEYAYSVDRTCDDFDFDFAYSDVVPVASVNVVDYGNWEVAGTSDLTGTTGKLNITSTNPTVLTTTNFVGEPIAIIELPGRPSFSRAINLGATQIIIDTEGVIRFYGEPDSVNPGVITLTDVYYEL